MIGLQKATLGSDPVSCWAPRAPARVNENGGPSTPHWSFSNPHKIKGRQCLKL